MLETPPDFVIPTLRDPLSVNPVTAAPPDDVATWKVFAATLTA